MVKKRIFYSDDSDDDHQCTKKQKSKSDAIQSMECDALKLTDLKAELLMRTIDELYLDDLSSVAMVNKQFNHLVYNYVGEKCTAGRVTIFNSRAAEWLWISNTLGKFKFDNPAELVKFFQTSGHLIIDLLIDCEPNYATASYKCMERAIFKYCPDALEHIEIRSTFLPVLNDWTKHPLPKVGIL